MESHKLPNFASTSKYYLDFSGIDLDPTFSPFELKIFWGFNGSPRVPQKKT
jgi:hypothetical protein